MRNTTTTVVIAAAGLVLAAVIVTRTPGQQAYGGANGACCLPTGGCLPETETGCATMGGTFLGDTTSCAGSTCPSAPTVVAGAVAFPALARGGNATVDSEVAIALRFWSDGQVDATRVFSQRVAGSCGGTPATVCDGPTVLLTGTCPTDVDRDGDTGINDFLTLLGGWGACR